jgi:hypothetical protein
MPSKSRVAISLKSVMTASLASFWTTVKLYEKLESIIAQANKGLVGGYEEATVLL